MHIRMVYQTHIETFETRADGGAKITHVALSIERDKEEKRLCLTLWSQLKIQNKPDDEEQTQEGTPEVLAAFELRDLAEVPQSISEYLALMGKEQGLLRFDIDGEVIWQADVETPIEDVAEVDLSQYPEGSTIVL